MYLKYFTPCRDSVLVHYFPFIFFQIESHTMEVEVKHFVHRNHSFVFLML